MQTLQRVRQNYVNFGFLGGASGQEAACQCRRPERQVPSLGQEDPLHGNPFHYSFLENSIDREAWRTTVHRVAKSRTEMT